MFAIWAVLAAACSAFDGGSDDVATGGGAGIEDLIDRLAEAGIAVYADPADSDPLVEPSEPVSPLRLLEWHVDMLGVRAADLVGVAAEDLDAMVPPEEVEGVEVSVPMVVAGWLEHGDSPAAELAAEVMGNEVANPDSAVFPDLVLLLFTSDVATAGSLLDEPTEPPRLHSGVSRGPLRATRQERAHAYATTRDVVDAPCSSLTNFVSETIASVFDAIGKLQSPGEITTGIGGFVGKFVDTVVTTVANAVVDGVNFVIDAAEFVLETGARLLIKPFMEIVGTIAGIVGTVTKIASFILPWTTNLIADPEETTRVTKPEDGIPGRFDLDVQPVTGRTEWPPWIADCAETAGQPLPELTPSGNPVEWDTISNPGLVAFDDPDRTLLEGGRATAHYRTEQEPRYRDPVPRQGEVRIRATVTRDDTRELQQAVSGLVHQAFQNLVPPIGGLIGQHVWALVQSDVTAAFKLLEEIRKDRKVATVTVHYNEGDEEDAEPDEPTDERAFGPPCPNGQWRMGTTGAHPFATSGRIELTIAWGTATFDYQNLTMGMEGLEMVANGQGRVDFIDDGGSVTVTNIDWGVQMTMNGVDMSPVMAEFAQLLHAWNGYRCVDNDTLVISGLNVASSFDPTGGAGDDSTGAVSETWTRVG